MSPQRKAKSSARKLDVNSASEKELLSVKGIGYKTVGKILSARKKGTVFNSFDELNKVVKLPSSSSKKDIIEVFNFGMAPSVSTVNPGFVAGVFQPMPVFPVFPGITVFPIGERFHFKLKFEGAGNLKKYKVKVEYVTTTGKSTTTYDLKPELDITLISRYGKFAENNQELKIIVLSPYNNLLYSQKYFIEENETIEISLANYILTDKQIIIKFNKPDGAYNSLYDNYKVYVETKYKRFKEKIQKDEFALLPDFTNKVFIYDVEEDGIVSVTIKVVTAIGEVLNTNSEDITDLDDDIINIDLPAPKQIEGDVILVLDQAELNIWADHIMLVSYDILDKADGILAARVEKEYSIYTTNDNKGKSDIKQEYYGLVEKIFFQVKSPRGEIIGRGEHIPDPEENEFSIEINVPPREIREIIDLKKYPDRPKKTTGRIIEILGKVKFKDVQVVIYSTDVDDAVDNDYYPLLTTTTNAEGYFEFVTPREPVKDAYAIVGIESNSDDNKIPIRLDNDDIVKKVINDGEILEVVEECKFFPASIILVIDADGDDDEDCESGDCKLNFHRPHKVLEEFTYSSVVRTTEPQIRSYTLYENGKMKVGDFLDLVVDYDSHSENLLPVGMPTNFEELELDQDIVLKHTNSRKGLNLKALVSAINESKARELKKRIKPINPKFQNRAPGRELLNANSSIDWDEDPTIYQATSLAHGHILNFKQEWIDDGYALGDLIYSLPLAPGQKKQIVTLDWEKRQAATGTEILEYQENLDNSLSRDRDVNEIVAGIITQNTQGGSTAKTSSKSGGGGFGAGVGGFFGVLFGIGGGYSGSSGSSRSSSRAWQNSSRKSSMQNLQHLTDSTRQVASAVRSQKGTVIQTASEGERFSVETESVANYNHCHAITMQYFEVLRHFKISHRLSNVQECLFIPLEMSMFDAKKSLRWREDLSKYLLNDPYSRKLELRRLIRFSRNPLLKGFDAIERIENNYESSDLPTGQYADTFVKYVEGTLYMSFNLNRPKDEFDEAGELKYNNDFLGWGGIGRMIYKSLLEKYYKKKEARDKYFENEIAPKIASEFVNNLKFVAELGNGSTIDIPIDATLLSKYRRNRPLRVSLRMDAGSNFEGVRRSDIKFVRVEIDKNKLNLFGIEIEWPKDLLPDDSMVVVKSGFMSYKTDYISSYLFKTSSIDNDMTNTDFVKIYTPLNSAEERNPRKEDKELADSLLDHLNDNLEYYHTIIWSNMSPRRRFMFLDGIQVKDYSEADVYPDGVIRSVASVVENRVIGIEGNSMIMPVSPGFRLDPNLKGKEVDLDELYTPITPIEPIQVSVPTKGVFGESVIGDCNSCEKKEEDRFWRWEESPIPDNPTAILPVSTESRKSAALDTEPNKFPNPMVQIQNAPAAPDPSGFAALSKLLANPNFENITGLDANQKNALEALAASYKTTTEFGKMNMQTATKAMTLATQLEAINKSKANNKIDDKTAKSLTEKALKNSINKDSQGVTDKIISDLKGIADLKDKGVLSDNDAKELKEKILKSVNNKTENKLIGSEEVKDAITRAAKDPSSSIEIKEDGTELNISRNEEAESEGE